MLTKPTQTRLLSFGVFVLFAGGLIASLFFRENLLWMDEILSYIVISDPSLAHLNEAVVSGFEQTPPVFNNLYWLIGHAVSLNVVFLKAVSIVLFAGTLALFYRYTTRLIGTPVVNFLLITGLAAFTYLNITLAAQIRSYVVFFAVGFAYFVLIHRLTSRPAQAGLLLAHTAVGLLLALTHNFGLFYLAAAGAFFGLLWLWSNDGRYWSVLGSLALIGLIWLLAWYPSFAQQAKAGEPHSWIPLPTFRSFFQIVGELAPTVSNKLESTGAFAGLAVLRFVGLLALFAYIAVPKLKNGFRAAVADPAFMLYLLAGFVHVVTVLIALVVSLTFVSVFISRYLWPSHLLVIYQLVYAVYFFAGRWAASRPNSARRAMRGQVYARLGWLVPAYGLGLATLLFYQSRKLVLAPTTVMAYVDQLDKKYPVFLESSLYFMPVWFYGTDRPVRFLLDRASAFDARNYPGATVGYHTLEAVKRMYNVEAVVPVAEFNGNRVPHFFVVDERWNYQIERFLQTKSVRVVRTVPTHLDGVTILECEFNRPPVNPVQTAAR